MTATRTPRGLRHTRETVLGKQGSELRVRQPLRLVDPAPVRWIMASQDLWDRLLTCHLYGSPADPREIRPPVHT